MQVKIFKVGEDFIIGQVGDQAGEGNVKIIKPLFILMTQQGLRLADVLTVLTDEDSLILAKSKITYTLEPAKEVYEGYKQTISPIELPTSKLIH